MKMHYLLNNKLKFISNEIYRTTSRMVAADHSCATYKGWAEYAIRLRASSQKKE